MTFLVEENCQRFGLPQLVDSSEEILQDSRNESHSREMKKLLEFANVLAPRFQSAREHWFLMQEVNHLISASAALKRPSTSPSSPSGFQPQRRKRQRVSLDSEGIEAMELELLNHAMCYLDHFLAYGNPTL